MTDIWNEKPEVTPYGDFHAHKFSTRHFGLYPAKEMDAWLERLKKHCDTSVKEQEYREYIDNKIIESASKEQELLKKLEAIKTICEDSNLMPEDILEKIDEILEDNEC